MLKEERDTDEVRVPERAWIRAYGPPKRLQFDEARCFWSREVTVNLQHFGAELDISPGEAHSRMGIVERRHLTMRTTAVAYLDDLHKEATLENVRGAMMHMAAAMNGFHAWFYTVAVGSELQPPRPIRSDV